MSAKKNIKADQSEKLLAEEIEMVARKRGAPEMVKLSDGNKVCRTLAKVVQLLRSQNYALQWSDSRLTSRLVNLDTSELVAYVPREIHLSLQTVTLRMRHDLLMFNVYGSDDDKDYVVIYRYNKKHGWGRPTVNYGLPKGVKLAQLVPGAIVTVRFIEGDTDVMLIDRCGADKKSGPIDCSGLTCLRADTRPFGEKVTFDTSMVVAYHGLVKV